MICDIFMVISHAPHPNERIQNENVSIVFGFSQFVSNGFEHQKTALLSKALCVRDIQYTIYNKNAINNGNNKEKDCKCKC